MTGGKYLAEPKYSGYTRVMICSPTSLAQADRSLLERFFVLHGDLAALAQETGRSLLDLNLWADSSDIAPIIELHRINAAAARREKALAALDSVLKTSEDPIELRRTACALLRWLRVPRHAGFSRLSELDQPLPSTRMERSCAVNPSVAMELRSSTTGAPHAPAPRAEHFSPISSIINLFREPISHARPSPGTHLTAAGAAPRADSG
jgi:hypothetical protein